MGPKEPGHKALIWEEHMQTLMEVLMLFALAGKWRELRGRSGASPLQRPVIVCVRYVKVLEF